jgi:hypothetical protein
VFRIGPWRGITLAILTLAWLAPFCVAQTDPDAPAASAPPAESIDVVAPPSPAPASQGEVAVRVEAFGVGDVVREGDWAGIRLALTDRSDRPREVAVQLHLPDADGDTPLYTRVITLNPGREVGVWLYAPMPWSMRQNSVVRVSVHRATASASGVEIGEQLAWAPITARRVVQGNDALVAAVGATALGLEQYAITFRERLDNPGAHELTQSVLGLTPQALPDQWQGLAAFETIVWSEGDPASIVGEGPARALREWVHRGGHLVIVLPAVGQTWTSASNPLADLLPAARPDRLVDADMNVYRTLLGVPPDRALPTSSVVHRFEIDAEVEPRDATPIITGPHGHVVVRRLVGTGMVSVIGLDLNSRALARGQYVRGDAFWTRVLGKRAATMSVAEMDTYAAAATGAGWLRPGTPVWIDDRLGTLISKGREASVGVLLGLVVFIVYYLVALISHPLLRRRGLVRHSWVTFVSIAAFFTLAAWGGASAMRPRAERAWHYTLLDHVYGQPAQRARSFISVLLPSYGDQTVTLGEPGTDASWSQSLVPFADPASDSTLSFPDARGYLADVRSLTSLRVPARSTIKAFRAEWLGGPRWSMPVPPGPEQHPRADSRGGLSGTLVHALPAALADVRVIYVRGQISETAGAIRRDVFDVRPLVADAFVWSLPRAWEPNTPLDLSAFVPNAQASATPLLRDLVPNVSPASLPSLPDRPRPGYFEDLVALYGLVEQPDPTRSSGASFVAAAPAVLQRRSLHTLDLAEWFTQPCLIIIGTVDAAPTPFPLRVDDQPLDGRVLENSGTTVVRWIYPLAPRPHPVASGPASFTPAHSTRSKP